MSTHRKTSKKKTLKQYYKYGQQAVELFQCNKQREAADKYLIAFDVCPDKTEPNRWQVFHGYTSLLMEQYFEPNEQDKDALKRIRDDKTECKLYRVEAGFKYGLLNYFLGNRFETAESYREAIRISKKKNPKEDSSKILEARGGVGGQIQFRRMDEATADIVQDIEDNLNRLTRKSGDNPFEALFRPPQIRSDGKILDDTLNSKHICLPLSSAKASNFTRDEFDELSRVSGDTCDCCQKANVPLSICARCKMTFYCSKECQKKQWALGHKKFCRKSGEFKEGDFARLEGLAKKTELNGAVVTVMSDADSTGRCKVQIGDGVELKGGGDGENLFAVSTEKMKHLRPLDCLKRFQAGGN